MESSFEKYKKNWIIDVVSWYAWGELVKPTYREVWAGWTGHREAVKVLYDKDKIQYSDLLQILWRTANPTDSEWQYVDRGFVYTSAVFYENEEEKEIATKSLQELEKSWRFWDKKLITPIIEYKNFYDAEEYHQDYYIKNPVRYNVYTNWSWRKEFLEKTWGDDLYYNFNKKENMKKTTNYKWEKLTDLQIEVTQESWTERPFDNTYWDNKTEGIYVDLIDWVPLYSSLDKYKSWTGWPSFTKPIDIKNIEKREDNTLFSKRTEIVWAKSNSHIGHVFDDGPEDKWGLRYCMNSASLKFIAKTDLEKEWYWEYLKLFTK
jgi:peptide methionine sulfoxide reductase msrA/msrB